MARVHRILEEIQMNRSEEEMTLYARLNAIYLRGARKDLPSAVKLQRGPLEDN